MAERWAFLNGCFCLEKEAVIPITDRGFLFGDGIFTSIRVHQGQCELLQAHIQRLQQHAKALDFHLDDNAVDEAWVGELIRRSQAVRGTWRLKIIVTVQECQGMRKPGCLAATLSPYEGMPFSPCRLCSFPYPLERPLAHIKSLAYLDQLYVRSYAQQRGYDDAVTHTHLGHVLETGSANLFWIDQAVCWIPDTELPYLKGVFLQALLPHVPFPVEYVRATMEQIPPSANVYMCNALMHVRPVMSVDAHSFTRCKEYDLLLRESIGPILATVKVMN